MPNRMLKETIRTSKSVNNLSDFQFRLWVYLITYVDDYGRGSADPELLKGFAFPRRRGITEQQIKDALAVLANSGMITLYIVDGESYFYFPKWSDHQKIQAKQGRFPEPPSENKKKEESKATEAQNGLQRIPTIDEVTKYCADCGYTFSASDFFETYSKKKWTIRGEPIQDWKAVAAAWEKKEKMFRRDRCRKDYGFSNYDQTPIRMENLKDIIVLGEGEKRDEPF